MVLHGGHPENCILKFLVLGQQSPARASSGCSLTSGASSSSSKTFLSSSGVAGCSGTMPRWFWNKRPAWQSAIAFSSTEPEPSCGTTRCRHAFSNAASPAARRLMATSTQPTIFCLRRAFFMVERKSGWSSTTASSKLRHMSVVAACLSPDRAWGHKCQPNVSVSFTDTRGWCSGPAATGSRAPTNDFQIP